MSLIINQVAVLSADKVIEKTKEIMNIWRETGHSVGCRHKIAEEMAVYSVTMDHDVVQVVLFEKD